MKVSRMALMPTCCAALLFCNVCSGFCSRHNTADLLNRQAAKQAENDWREVVKELTKEGLTLENFQKHEDEFKKCRERVEKWPRRGKCRAASLRDAESIIRQAIEYMTSSPKDADLAKRLQSFIGPYGKEVDAIIQAALDSDGNG